MNGFVIMTDSSCDLPAEIAAAEQLRVLPLTVTINDKEYRNLLDGSEIGFPEFYAMLRNGMQASTAAVSVGTYADAMDEVLASGSDLLCISFSSGLSNTYNASRLAADEMSKKYPDRKIFVVDTLAASLGEGMLVYLACRKRAEGAGIDEVRDWLEENKLHLCHWFTVDSLSHLRRGGRIAAAKAIIGSLLHVKPVMHMDNDGHLINIETARGRNNALARLADKMGERVIDPASQTVFISHADDIEAARKLAAAVRERFGVKDVIINYVGPVIGAHCGPGTVALFFTGTER